MVVFYFILFLIVFTFIGVSATKFKSNTTKDYLLASSTISPFFSGISAAASTYSGFMFTGFVGYVFTNGFAAIWFIVFMFLGEFCSTFFTPFIQQSARKTKAYTYVEMIVDMTGGYQILRKLLAIIILLFLGVYASSQILSSTKALHELLEWNPFLSVLVATAIIIAYSYAGGLRASIWTDVAQGTTMLIAIAALGFYSLQNLGGYNELYFKLKTIDPNLVSWRPQNLKFGIAAFAIGWFSHGFFGLLGQPHVMNRYMALRTGAKNTRKASLYFIGFSILFTCFLTLVSLAIRTHYAEVAFDHEVALLRFSKETFSNAFLGLILAGLFSSTISTADSQILVCASALTRNFFPKNLRKKHPLASNKFAVVLIAICVGMLSLYENQTVFSTVVLSWGILGVAFTPFLLANYFKLSINSTTSVCMLITGIATALLWHYNRLDSNGMTIMLPGISASFLSYYLCKAIGLTNE